MKRFRILICLLGCMILFSACSGKESSSESIVTKDSNTTSASKENSSSEPTSTSEEESTDEELIFYPEDISVNWWSYAESLIPTSKGFYRLEGTDERYLYFYDIQGEKTLVCGKPNCRHDNENCDAYIPANMVTYWDGRFFYVTDKREMISMLPDTSDRRLERSNIGEYDPESYNGFLFDEKGFYQHYYICRMVSSKLIRSGEDDMRLEDETRLLIYDLLKPEEEPICLATIITADNETEETKLPVYLSGNYVSLQKPEEDSLYLIGIDGDPYIEGAPRKLLVWSFEEKKLKTLIDIPQEAANRIDVHDGMLYYRVPDEGIWRVSIHGGEPEKIISANPYLNIVQFDDQYIYISVETDYQIYDMDGNLLNSLPLTREMQSWKLIILSKCNDTLLFGTRLRGVRKVVYTLDYTKIGTEELEWEAFP